MYVYHMHFWCLQRSEEDIRFPGGWWDLNLGPVAEPPVLLISEPFLHLSHASVLVPVTVDRSRAGAR